MICNPRLSNYNYSYSCRNNNTSSCRWCHSRVWTKCGILTRRLSSCKTRYSWCSSKSSKRNGIYCLRNSKSSPFWINLMLRKMSLKLWLLKSASCSKGYWLLKMNAKKYCKTRRKTKRPQNSSKINCRLNWTNRSKISTVWAKSKSKTKSKCKASKTKSSS